MIPSHSAQQPLQSERVISPFAQSEVSILKDKEKGGRLLWIVGLGLLLLFCGVIAGTFSIKYLSNPYRTLESFPVGKYFDGYQGLAGSKFKAEFRVEADLGWKDGAGRLMLFSTQDDPRPMAVLIPSPVSNGSNALAFMSFSTVIGGGKLFRWSRRRATT